MLTYAYVGGMLNVAFLTGFVRKPTATGFLIQQTNNINLAVPVGLEERVRTPREGDPITVTCHVRGVKHENGERSCTLSVINMEKPTLLSMPQWLVWNSRLPEGAPADDFRPFGSNGRLNNELLDGVSEDGADPLRGILEATGGRFDTTLGANANTVRIAGLIEGAAFARDSNGEVQQDCLTLLIRQHRDPDLSVPVRLYGRFARPYLERVKIGAPVSVFGQVRVRAKKAGEPAAEGEPVPMVKYPYIHCAHLRVADREVDIRLMPDWWFEMKERIVKERDDRRQTAAAAASGAMPTAADI